MAGNIRQQCGTGFLPGQTKLWGPRQSLAWAGILMFTRHRLFPVLNARARALFLKAIEENPDFREFGAETA